MFNLIYKYSRRSKIINKILKFIYKCEIPVNTNIGENVTFNHNGLGVVIHPNSIIKDNVYIEHHVCLGQRTGDDARAPIINKNVVIGAYAIILGNVEIGEHSVIGAGSLVLHDIPPHSIYYNNRTEVIKCNKM